MQKRVLFAFSAEQLVEHGVTKHFHIAQSDDKDLSQLLALDEASTAGPWAAAAGCGRAWRALARSTSADCQRQADETAVTAALQIIKFGSTERLRIASNST